MKILGLTGLARTGKNLFCDIAQDILTRNKIKTQCYSLAEPLKTVCADFIETKCDLDVWSSDTTEKAKFRDMLVWYADFKRKETGGKYWTSLLQQKMEKDEKKNRGKLNIITDVRFNEYAEDEVYWIKDVLKGRLIHIKKYSIVNGTKFYIQPPNLTEAENDPKMEAAADFCVDWEHRNFRNEDETRHSPYLVGKVQEALDTLMYLRQTNPLGVFPGITWKFNITKNQINEAFAKAKRSVGNQKMLVP
jgi:hypothetical protein